MAQPDPSSTATLSGGTSTKAALVDRVIRMLDDQTREDTLSGSLTDSGTSASTTDTGADAYEDGDILDFLDDDTYEAVFIVSAGSGTHTIRRGYWGTTAAAHASGAVFRKNPLFLSHLVSTLVDEATTNLYPDIPEYKVATYTTPSAPADFWYGLPADAEKVHQVYQKRSTTPVELTYPAKVGQVQFADSAFFTNSRGVLIQDVDTNISSFFVIYEVRPSVTTLTSAQQDIVVYSAARRALEAETGHRRFRQGEAFIFDASTKIQLWRREEQRLRDAEAVRIGGFLPRRDSILFRQRHRFMDGSL